jgi:hypothetical protein
MFFDGGPVTEKNVSRGEASSVGLGVAPDTAFGDDPDETGGLDLGDLIERVIVVASVFLIVGTLGYVGWQTLGATTGADPVARVDDVSQSSNTDQLRVGVRLENRRAAGLTSVQVGVQCGGMDRSLAFTHVPAGGQRTGFVHCPTGMTPEAAVETWIEA